MRGLKSASILVRVVSVAVSIALIGTQTPVHARASTTPTRSAANVAAGEVFQPAAADTTAPGCTISAPYYSATQSSRTSFGVSWAATDPSGIATYSVEFKDGEGGLWTAWKTTSSRSATFSGSAGHTYFFRARATDGASNRGAWSAVSMTTTPYDDRSSAISRSSGWTKAGVSNAYLRTTRYAKASGRWAKMSFTGKQVAVVVSKAKTRGKFAVYLDGSTKADKIVDTYSRTTRYRQVAYSHVFAQSARHSIKIKVLGTRGRPRVDLDGIAVVRPDTTKPTAPTVSLSSGATYTRTPTVSVSIAAQDNVDVYEMQLATSTSFAGASWKTFVSGTTFDLPLGEGAKTVYARVRDQAGNVSAVGSDSIVLDTLPPQISLASVEPTILAGSTLSVTARITDSWAVTARLVWRTGLGVWVATPMSAVGSTFTAEVPGQSAGVSAEYYVTAQDPVGNVSSDPYGAPGTSRRVDWASVLPPRPDIIHVTPSEATIGGVVVISGRRFGSAPGTVTVSGHVAPIDSWSDAAITAQVPVGASTGEVVVMEGGGLSSNPASITISGPVEHGRGSERYTSLATGVNVANGNLVLTGMSSSIPGNGEGTQITSSYNSFDNSSDAAGSGWTFSFEQRLIAYPDNNEAWLQPDGSMHVFGRKTDGTYMSAQGEYATLVKNGDDSFTLTDRDKNVYQFDSGRRLLSKTDRNGNSTTYTYSSGRATTMTDASGRVSTFDYDADGLLVTITDCAGRVSDFEYDASGRLVLMTLPVVQVGPDSVRYSIAYEYDTAGRLVGVTDARGKSAAVAYDGTSNRVASVTDPEGAATTFAYGEGTCTVAQPGRVPLDVVTNSAGLIVGSTGSGGVSVTQSYDVQLNRVGVVDGTGASVATVFDSQGRLIVETDPAGGTTLTSYTATATASEPASVTSPGGITVNCVYDECGNKLSETDPTGATTEFSYTEQGALAAITDPTGLTTSMTYDQDGNMTQLVEPGGATTDLDYNSLGLVTGGSSDAGEVGTMSYDALGRVTSVSDDSGTVGSYAYDENGNCVSEVDAKGNKLLSAYSDGDHLTEVVPDPVLRTQEATGCAVEISAGTVAYTYDSAGRIKTRTDQEGNRTTLAYDPISGLLMSETDAAGRATTYSYDVLGQMTGTSFPDGTSSLYAYNDLGQVTQQTAAGRTTNYTYDEAGNLCSETLVGGVGVTRTFDLAGRVTLDTVGSNSTGYSYDAAGRVTGVALSGLAPRMLAYDSAGRLATVTAGAAWEAVAYDPAGRPSTLSASTGEHSAMSYDGAGRLESVASFSSGDSTLSAFDYSYDENGSVASVADKTGTTRRYFYDNLNELINVRDEGGSRLFGYVYDQAGSRQSAYRSGEGTTTYSYDTSDSTRLLSSSGPGGGVSWTYDDQGRVSSRTTTAGMMSFDWAADGYLSSVALPDGGRVSYDYDASWRRVSRSVYSAGTTTTVEYQYDGDALVAEKTPGGLAIASYTYGADGRLATMSRGGHIYRYQLDALGSVVSLCDESGSIVNSYTYDPFGRVLEETEGVENPFTFAGYWQDPDTGYYHLRARWYEPETGRFLTKDALRDVAGEPLSANHYLYCGNDPVNRVDPEGTWWRWVHGALAAVHLALAAVDLAAFIATGGTSHFWKGFEAAAKLAGNMSKFAGLVKSIKILLITGKYMSAAAAGGVSSLGEWVGLVWLTLSAFVPGIPDLMKAFKQGCLASYGGHSFRRSKHPRPSWWSKGYDWIWVAIGSPLT